MLGVCRGHRLCFLLRLPSCFVSTVLCGVLENLEELDNLGVHCRLCSIMIHGVALLRGKRGLQPEPLSLEVRRL